MSNYIPEKVARLEEYTPTQDVFPIKLDANESFLQLSPELRAELLQRIVTFDFCKYPDPGAERLCAAYADYIGLPQDQVVAGNGSDELISILISAFLEKGRKVLTFSQDFSMYRFYAGLAEMPCLVCEKDENFEIDFDAAAQLARDQEVGLIIFSNPCNPVGNVFPKEKVFDFVRSVDALVVVDEAYMDFSDQSLVDRIDETDNLVILRTCSKAFGMAALRLGFALSNWRIINSIRKVKSPFNVNSLSQTVGELVISQKEQTARNIREIKESTARLYQGLKALEGRCGLLEKVYPTQTNFIYIRCEKAKIVQSRLREEGISIRAFGDGHLRITAGSSAENQRLLRELEQMLSREEYVYEKIRGAAQHKGDAD